MGGDGNNQWPAKNKCTSCVLKYDDGLRKRIKDVFLDFGNGYWKIKFNEHKQ